jgi:hypothetical protein
MEMLFRRKLFQVEVICEEPVGLYHYEGGNSKLSKLLVRAAGLEPATF